MRRRHTESIEVEKCFKIEEVEGTPYEQKTQFAVVQYVQANGARKCLEVTDYAGFSQTNTNPSSLSVTRRSRRTNDYGREVLVIPAESLVSISVEERFVTVTPKSFVKVEIRCPQ